jgi:hypothetical protein
MRHRCEIHDVELVERAVPLSFGLAIRMPDREAAAKGSFPNAWSFAFGGCCIEEQETSRTPVCLDCRRAETEWREKHEPAYAARRQLDDLFARPGTNKKS